MKKLMPDLESTGVGFGPEPMLMGSMEENPNAIWVSNQNPV